MRTRVARTRPGALTRSRRLGIALRAEGDPRRAARTVIRAACFPREELSFPPAHGSESTRRQRQAASAEPLRPDPAARAQPVRPAQGRGRARAELARRRREEDRAHLAEREGPTDAAHLG